MVDDIEEGDENEFEVSQEQEEIDQENSSVQEGYATAETYAEHADVSADLDPWSLGGIDASSNAWAVADLEQSADQDNSNSQAAYVELTEEVEVDQEQEDIDQENVSEQEGETYSLASSDYVEVDLTGGLTDLEGTGISAEFVAKAQADLEQSAEQENSNSQVVARPEFATIGLVNGELEVEEQGQEDIDQSNESEQEGWAVAEAYSEHVDVESDSTIDAGLDGIAAESKALAFADLDQTVDQENDNSQTATGSEIGDDEEQGQEYISQENINAEWNELTEEWEPGQEGYAYATAESSYVEVSQSGALTANGGTGIDAESTAIAKAKLEQSADQDNSNSQLAILEAGEPGDEIEADQEQEEIEQENVSVQYGEAIAEATSDDVDVYQFGGLTAFEDGINAELTAVAIAKLEQDADQSNINSQTVIAVPGVAVDDVDQEQDIEQSNLNDQEGIAEAYATSGEVFVKTVNDPSEEDAVDATSEAVAVAEVDQEAYQENINSQLSVAAGELEQEADVDQENESEQEGFALAVAEADDVEVVQDGGTLYAGQDGIDADSSAKAVATVDQDVTQSNQTTHDLFDETYIEQENEAEQDGLALAAAASGAVTIDQVGNLDVGGDGINAHSSAEAEATVEQEIYQENLVNGVDNLYGDNDAYQSAAAAAIALANEVSISTDGKIFAGDDGVVGISSASADAEISQIRPEFVIGNPGVVDLAPLGHQYGFNGGRWFGDEPDAFAYAEADEVNILINGLIEAGDTGVVAISKADADAAGDYPVAVAIADDVNVEIWGKVKAQGTGVFAGSFAKAEVNGVECTDDSDGCYEEQGDVTVSVQKGKVQGGLGYYGVVVKGGDDNLIEIAKGATITSKSRMAILGGTEDETVDIFGKAWGDIDLDGGWNQVNVFAGGQLWSGDILNVGSGNFVINEGNWSPGGPGYLQTTLVDGNVVQTPTGKYSVDVNQGDATSDRIDIINGGTADLAGKVRPTVYNPVTGKENVTILTAQGGVTDSGIGVKDTAVVDYSLKVNPNDVVLGVDVDFAPKGLAKDEGGVGQHLNQVYKNGGPDGLWPVTHALLELETKGDLSNAYRSLSGEDYRDLSVSELYSLERFSKDQMNCPARNTAAVVAPVVAPVPLKLGSDGTPYAGPPTFIDENQCVWARVRYRNLQQDANSGSYGFDEDATGVSGGAQWAWNGPWYGGVSFGYENSDISGSPWFSSNGDRYRVAGSLKYVAGPWYVGGVIAGNWSNFDSSRLISFPGFASVATSSQDFSDIGGQLRVAYEVNRGSWYWKPMVDLNVTNVDMDSFTEKGGSGAALRVSSNDETVFSATPALEIGSEWVMANGALVRPYVRGGVSFYNDANFPVSASFAAAPGVAPFTTTGEIDDVLGDVSAGVSFMSVAGSVISFSYDGRFGDTIEEHSATAKGSVKF